MDIFNHTVKHNSLLRSGQSSSFRIIAFLVRVILLIQSVGLRSRLVIFMLDSVCGNTHYAFNKRIGTHYAFNKRIGKNIHKRFVGLIHI